MRQAAAERLWTVTDRTSQVERSTTGSRAPATGPEPGRGPLVRQFSSTCRIHTTSNVDRSGGALQVLGTPANSVIFTSLYNDSIGGRSDSLNFTGVLPGDWGGIVYQQSSDFQGKDWAGKGVYLDSVNQANLTY